MEFYRTYIVKFIRSSGVYYYAGKHKSKYINPSDDPYFGSGNELKLAVAKHGLGCIISIDWFEHTEALYAMGEIELISKLKNKHGDNCVNRARGGCGGDTLKYLTNSELEKVKSNMSIAQKIQQNKTGVRISKSNAMKLHWSNQEWRIRMLELANDPSLIKIKPETMNSRWKSEHGRSHLIAAQKSGWDAISKKTQSDRVMKLRRVGKPHWDLYYSGEFIRLLGESECVSYTEFYKWLNCNTIHKFTIGQVQSVFKHL